MNGQQSPSRNLNYYGLTTEDAIRAYKDGRLDLLSSSNRFKFALTHHEQGMHAGATDDFARICPACRIAERQRVA